MVPVDCTGAYVVNRRRQRSLWIRLPRLGLRRQFERFVADVGVVQAGTRYLLQSSGTKFNFSVILIVDKFQIK